MYNEKLPIGDPIFYTGKYKEDKVYNLYVQMITCCFEIKENKIPTIQIKQNSYFKQNEYLTSSNNRLVCLVLTNVDLALFLEHYNVYDLEYIGGYKFKSIQGIFNKYIDKWIEIKNNGTLSGNLGQRTLAKLMLNSLYGKFCTSLEVRSKSPYLSEEGIVKYKLEEPEEKEGIYLPIGSFITAYARNKTIRTSQSIKEYSIKKYGIDKYIYSDTDSIHTTLSIEELKQFCDIDNVKLGAWKHEASFKKARFVRQKCYIEEFENKKIKLKGKINKININKKYTIKSYRSSKFLKITCAGMPEKCYNYVNWNNFHKGFSCKGNLKIRHVKGGVKLEETTFELKDYAMKTNINKFDKK